MKKIIALLMAITLIFTLCACSKSDTSLDTSSSIPADTQAFVKPKDYASVLLITINPQFNLYLDKEGVVLAVEALNEDAKTFEKDIAFENKKFDAVVETLITKANENGFIKENATIDFKITEKKDESVDATLILNNVTKTAKETSTKLEIQTTVTTEDKTAENEAVESQPDESQPTESEPVQSEPSEQTEAHTHKYSDATCTEAKKCSCGATDGAALGHDYKNGACSRCNAKDPSYVTYTPLSQKGGVWSVEFLNGETYCSAELKLTEPPYIGVSTGDPLSSMEQEVQDDIRNNKDNPDYMDSYIVYKGKEYWSARGSGATLKPISESDNIVTLTAKEEEQAQIVFTRTGEDTLTVKSVSQTFKDMIEDIPIGTIFTFSK